MWLSKREKTHQNPGAAALTGPVTLPGKSLGVWLEGERREVAVFAPGGYHWAPQAEEQVLVLKTGESGEQPCAIAVALPEDETLAPGEVLIQAPNASVRLDRDGVTVKTGKASLTLTPGGGVNVKGSFNVNGTEIGPPPKGEEGEGN